MNRKGVFGFVITLVVLAMLIWIWAIITPAAVTPAMDTALNATANDPHADGVEFFVRMIPWAVPLIIIIGMLWVGATR